MDSPVKPVDLPQGSAPFSAQGYVARAQARALPLSKAAWMFEQPLSYGIDAAKSVDEGGNTIWEHELVHLVDAGGWKDSAVLVPVIAREPEVTVLLTLRPSHLASHAGQIAFPGGKLEPEDETPVAAALREAEEEVGLAPELVTPLGLLDLHKTGTGYRIVPVLGLVSPDFVPRPDPGEVADVFEVPLSFLMAEENHLQHLLDWKDRRLLFHAMKYEGRFIWGATSAIIKTMHHRLYMT